MRLIDADSIKGFALTIILKEVTSNLLKGHTKGKDEVIRKSVETFLKIIEGMPEYNPWHYPSKGELPAKGEKVWDGYDVMYYDTALKRWYEYYKDEPIETPMIWMPLPYPPKEKEE